MSRVTHRVCTNFPFSQSTLELINTYLIDPSLRRRRASQLFSAS